MSKKTNDVENQNDKIDYDYFFTPLTNARAQNYLKKMGDKVLSARGKKFKFATGNPNPRCFPYEQITVKLKTGDAFEINGEDLSNSLSYMSISGHLPLINILKNFQDRWHDCPDWEKKNLTTTTGSQAGLYQLLDGCIMPGDPVLVQSPMYPGLLTILKPLNVEFLELDNGAEEICPKKLKKILYERKERSLPMPKILYINPTGTNPTGDIISTQKKREIYKMACDYNFLIVEDDPYYLLAYRENVISFLSLDTENRVVRLDSISKTLGAGFRIGYVTAAREIIDKLNLIKETSNYCPPFCQAIVYGTLNQMGFDGFMNHISTIRNFYSKNCQTILASVEKHLKDLATWVVPEAGMFIWLTILNVDHIPDSFVDKCIANAVFLVPGYAFYANKRQSPCIRLAFSMLNEDEIDEGIKALARVIEDDLLNRKN